MHRTFVYIHSYKAYNGESVVLLAGVELPTNQFTVVTDPYILSLLQPQVKDKIIQVCSCNYMYIPILQIHQRQHVFLIINAYKSIMYTIFICVYYRLI